jgi:hypothetical protein
MSFVNTAVLSLFLNRKQGKKEHLNFFFVLLKYLSIIDFESKGWMIWNVFAVHSLSRFFVAPLSVLP